MGRSKQSRKNTVKWRVNNKEIKNKIKRGGAAKIKVEKKGMRNKKKKKVGCKKENKINNK